MGLDDVFRYPPVWDTDSEESDLAEQPARTKRRNWGGDYKTSTRRHTTEQNDSPTPPARLLGSALSRDSSSRRLSSISENGPVFVRPSLIRSVLSSSNFIHGDNTIQLSVLSVAGSDKESKMLRASAQVGSTISLEDSSRALNLAPRHLLDVERGKSIVFTSDRSLVQQQQEGDEVIVIAAKSAPLMSETDSAFFKTCGQSLLDKVSSGVDFSANDEVFLLGGAWRRILKWLIMKSHDEVNALLLTRQLQLFVPFLTVYEAYVLGQLIEAFDIGRDFADIEYALNVAFRNRNTSRILTQLVGPRYDFLWHWSTMVTWNRSFDAFGQVPVVGITSFPPTENVLNTRKHALTSMLRIVLGKGKWLTRAITGREGLITDDPCAVAQNLAAESNGFELANRNQYGTYIGRRKTNEFRFLHRLPVDESIVRTFVSLPMQTLLNNGAVHVLRQLAKHWKNTLTQKNFAHQRMEQLNPFETLRVHMPVVLLTLSSLRGRNKWDSDVLGPMMKRLQTLKPSFSIDVAKSLVHELKESIVVNVCGGIALMIDPFRSWLEAIRTALEKVEQDARDLYSLVTSVEIGIRLGHDLISSVNWKVPSDGKLKTAIFNHIRGLGTGDVSERCVTNTLALITPRDKRTLIELVKSDYSSSRPAQLLLGRAKTLLQRELRRQVLNEKICELSKGRICKEPEKEELYWLESENDCISGVYMFDEKVSGSESYRFVHVDTRSVLCVALTNVTCRQYVPVAEAISRAQRAFMNIELGHGTTFSLDAFQEFTFLRHKLRQLVVISQITCEAIDNARLNLLVEVQRSTRTQVSVKDLEVGKTYYTYDSKQREYVPFLCRKEYGPSDCEWNQLALQEIVSVPPQSCIVIGSGPTGMATCIHCTEAVLASGGTMKIFEARDSFTKGSAAFERAQIVRLDARWIAMLRYHLGTGFEDVFIPASGETDAQLGNTLPDQGFVEITIKDLEQMLHVEVSKMWSKGLITVYTGSRASYDHVSNTVSKYGEHLKVGDDILRPLDEEGRRIRGLQRWTVVEINEIQPLAAKEVVIGEEYGIYSGLGLVLHTLVGIDLRTDTYVFALSNNPAEELLINVDSWPTVYPASVGTHGESLSVVVECKIRSKKGHCVRESLPIGQIKEQKFTMDVGQSHIIEAIGKPHRSKVHFQVTSSEPYGVLCAQGLKVSLGMHNFGEKRWRPGLVDDIRSLSDQNTRIVSDFTKMVRLVPVAQKMLEYMTDEKYQNWQLHFKSLMENSYFMARHNEIVPKIQQACFALVNAAPTFKRGTLQTRFFETGDNYYLGMELSREYVAWRDNLATELVSPLNVPKATGLLKDEQLEELRCTVMHHIDRLWYDGVLEVIRTGDVYNPGARHRVPRLYLINSYTDAKLGSLQVGESFRISASPEEKYEVLIKRPIYVIVRNVEGYISKLRRSTLVRREGDLTRGPDGNIESRVALATFPVAHHVNHRSLRMNNVEKGYVFAFIGDEQATPHFMRYSGLTGASINAMLFANFIKRANDGIPFVERYQEYTAETNWSNGEVVKRGTGHNYGEDGFLRPGFSYECVVNYLFSKVTEYTESGQDLDYILSNDWMDRLAASLVPRGMELNDAFINGLYVQLHRHVFNKFVKEAACIESDGTLREQFEIRGANCKMDAEAFWREFLLASLQIDDDKKKVLRDQHIAIAIKIEKTLIQVIDHAREAYLYNTRLSSELVNQPKPVDSIVDKLAVEAQNFSTTLTQSAAFAAGVLALKPVGDMISVAFSEIFALLNIWISFGTMTNSSRYRIRNEEARVIFADEKLLGVMKAVFVLMSRNEQDFVTITENPFAIDLEQKVAAFLDTLQYYDYDEPHEFTAAFLRLKRNVNDPVEIYAFMDLISTKILVDTCHVNSYVQETLVNIYGSLEEMLRLFTAYVPNRRDENAVAWSLFYRLVNFQEDLESTLQRGSTRWGFVKRRRLSQWDAVAMFKYLYNVLCCSSRFCTIKTAPISTRTLSIIQHTRHLSSMHDSKVLCREIRDLDGLYWATRESDIASLVFMNGCVVFIASFLIVIAFVVRNEVFSDLATFLALASVLGAILAMFHLWRKFVILVKLMLTLTDKVRSANTDERFSIFKIRQVAFAQSMLTLTLLLSAAASAVALPWSVANKEYSESISVIDQVPFFLAFGSVCGVALATIMFFVVEFVVRYKLPPTLGEFVCESFRSEIEDMYAILSVPPNNIDTKQVQERETWEYVAREFLHLYRFDAVFAADRFGSILQYIQGGMDRRQ